MTTLISRHLDVSSPPSISGGKTPREHSVKNAGERMDSCHVRKNSVVSTTQQVAFICISHEQATSLSFDIYLLVGPHQEMRWLSNPPDMWKDCVLPHTCRSSTKGTALRESPALYCFMITSVHILERHLAVAVNIGGLYEVIECTH